MASKILVVDDDPKWLRVVSLYLQAHDYRVDTAVDGEAALRKISEDCPDVIVADIGMPGLDGYELCSQIRRDARTRAIPFIFLTARDQDTDRTKARKIGSDDYLTKPCPLERLTQSVETLMDRLQLVRNIPLERIGLSGRLEDVDLLDMIQALEMEQRTGALVLSHGERTGTIYFQDGVIVEADIRSPKREEPLFILLGWKSGRFLFLPDAVPERMPITASMANLLLQDLRTLEEHEAAASPREAPDETGSGAQSELVGRILNRLEAVAEQIRTSRTVVGEPPPASIRLLVAGVRRSGKSELIHALVKDLSSSRWAAVGVEEPQPNHRIDVGRIRISPKTVLHLVAVRTEKRFWSVWEQYLPEATGLLLLVDPASGDSLVHTQAFLKAREALAPDLPVHALMPSKAADKAFLHLPDSAISVGSLSDQTMRLTALDELLQQWLDA
ncbi:MAG: response regulator [Nitrospirota bacterium]